MPKTMRKKLADFVLKQQELHEHVLEEMLEFSIENLTEVHGPKRMATTLQSIGEKLEAMANLLDEKPGSTSKH
jgi:hypothetical protein